jgi:hypothetical protein
MAVNELNKIAKKCDMKISPSKAKKKGDYVAEKYKGSNIN